MTTPMISILIPAWNRERYIVECVRSALAGALDDTEVLVIDDGSTDGTRKALERLASDPRLRIIEKAHTGAPDTRNLGLAEARGPWVLWLGSDDVLLPDTLARYRRAVAAEPNVDVFYGDLAVIDAEGKGVRELKHEDFHRRNAELVAKLVHGNCVPDPGTLVRQQAYERFGGYDRSFRRAHDYEFWTRVAGALSFRHVGGQTASWRWHDSNMSSGTVAIDTTFEARVIERLALRYPLRTLYPKAGWDQVPLNEAESAALLELAKRLVALGDLDGGLRRARESAALAPSAVAARMIEEIMKRTGGSRVAAAAPGERVIKRGAGEPLVAVGDAVPSGVWLHATALCESSEVGNSTQIWAYAHVLVGARIGRNCKLGDHTFVEGGAVLGDDVTLKNGVSVWDGVVLGDEVFVGPGAIFTNVRRPRASRKTPRENFERTLVERGATIGAGAVVVCGTRIGTHAMVGAGAVVTHEVAAHALVVGNPARWVAWVCACGEKLDPSLHCTCGLTYVAAPDGLHAVEAPGGAAG